MAASHSGTSDSLRFPVVVVVVGPTAVGKSQLALNLAQELSADIVTADSRQVYRYMDVGTAKPTAEEQSLAKHYMIDLVQPDDTYSAQRYRQEALRVLRRIGSANRIALVVGGTGFYLRALLDGLFLPSVPPDAELRQRLREEAGQSGSMALHERLTARDPSSAARIHPNNLPRVIRALEVTEHLGAPVPERAAQPQVDALYLGLTTDRTVLQQRADARIDAQVASGLVEEIELLLAMGYAPDLPALQGFGYQQVVSCLQGRLTLDEAIAAYKHATHQYIRRQTTWFGSDPRIHWIKAGDHVLPESRELIRAWTVRTLQASDGA